MRSRLFILAAAVGLLMPAPAEAQRVGDTCVAQNNVRLSSKPGGKGKKVTVRKGTRLIVSGFAKGSMQVETRRVQGWIRKMPIAKVCEGSRASARKGKKKGKKEKTVAAAATAKAPPAPETSPAPDLSPPPQPPEPTLAAVNPGDPAPTPTAPSDDPEPDAPPSEVPPESAAETSTMGTLTIEVNAVGAQVWVGGALLGFSPVPPQRLPPGIHEVKVQRSNSKPWSQSVEVVAGQDNRVAVALTLTGRLRPPGGGMQKTLAWTSIGVGGAGVLGAVGLYFAGRSKASGLEQDIETYNAEAVRTATGASDLEDRKKSIGTLDALSMAAAGVAVVGFATGALLLLVPDIGAEEEKPNPDDVNPWAQYGSILEWKLMVSPTGLGVMGSF